MEQTQSLFVAIIGRPNVGKSSLLNRLVGEKTAIVTPKPQTTRTRITGILTKGPVQYVFLDTPGFHQPRTRLGEAMTRTVREAMSEVDAIMMLFEPGGELEDTERELLDALKAGKVPALGVVNKVDTLPDTQLPTRLKEVENTGVFKQVLPVSAVTGQGCDALLAALLPYAVTGPHYFPEDAFTDLPEKQLVAEIVREKVLLCMREEIPHGTAVGIERFHERPNANIIDIDVTLYCEKKSHKGMVIGKGGQMLKKIASSARADCEALLGSKVNLQCWVKVKDDWRDDERFVKNIGML